MEEFKEMHYENYSSKNYISGYENGKHRNKGQRTPSGIYEKLIAKDKLAKHRIHEMRVYQQSDYYRPPNYRACKYDINYRYNNNYKCKYH